MRFITAQYSINISGSSNNLAERSEQISSHNYRSVLKALDTTLKQPLQMFILLSKTSHIILLFIYISSVVLWTVIVLSSKSSSLIFLTYQCQKENKFTWRLFAAKEPDQGKSLFQS